MISHPKTEELVRSVALWLEQIRPSLDPRNAFLARVAGNALATIERELTLGPQAEAKAIEKMAEILGHSGAFDALNTELCDRIASGELTVDTPGLLEALHVIAFDQLAIDQPRYQPEGSL